MAIDPEDIKVLEQLRRQNRHNGTWRLITGKKGRQVVQVAGREFTSPSEAGAFMNEFGVTSDFVFKPHQPLLARPRVGPARFMELERLSDELGWTIHRTSLDMPGKETSDKVVEMLTDSEKGRMGLFLSDKRKAKVLRFFDQRGVEQSEEEILAGLKRIGWDLSPGKLLKRLNYITNRYELQALFDSLKVAVFDITETRQGKQDIQRYISGSRGYELREEDIQQARKDLLAKHPRKYKYNKPLLEADARKAAAREAVEKGVDGELLASRGFMDKFIKSMDDQLSQMEKEIARLKDPVALEEAKKDFAAMKSQRDRLSRAVSSGRGARFNVRLFGGDIVASDKTKRALAERLKEAMGGKVDPATLDLLLKGDITVAVGGRREMAQMLRRIGLPADTDVDIIAPIQAVTKELKRTKRILPGQDVRKATAGLQWVDVGTKVRLDAQTMFGHPELADPQAMTQRTLDYFRENVEEFKSGNILESWRAFRRGELREDQLPGMLRQLLADSEFRVPYDADGVSRTALLGMERRINQAKSIIMNLDSGIDPVQDQQFLRYFLNSVRQELLPDHLSRGVPPLIMPNTMRAHISSDLFAAEEIASGERAIRPGQLRFDPQRGWIMHRADIARHSPALGGFDLDDMMNAQFAWDEKRKSLIVAGIRSPTARGEILAMEVPYYDESVPIILRSSSPEARRIVREQYDMPLREIREYRRQLAGVKEEIKSYGRRPPSETSTEDVEGRLEELRNQREELKRQIEQRQRQREAFLSEENLIGTEESPGLLRKHVKGTIDYETIQKRSISTNMGLINEGRGEEAYLPNWVKYTSLEELDQEKIAQLGEENLRIAEDIAAGEGIPGSLEKARILSRESSGVLEHYSNVRMVIDNLIETNAGRLPGDEVVRILQQEEVIDALIQSHVGGKQIEALTTEILDKIVDLIGKHGFEMEAGLIAEEGSPMAARAKSRLSSSDKAYVTKQLEIRHGKQLSDAAVRTRIGDIYETYETQVRPTVSRDVAKLRREGGMVPELYDTLFTAEEITQAREIGNVYTQAKTLAETTEIVQGMTAEEEYRTFGEILSDTTREDQRNIQRLYASAETMRTFKEKYFVNGEMTNEGRRIFGALIQGQGSSGGGEFLQGELSQWETMIGQWFKSQTPREELVAAAGQPLTAGKLTEQEYENLISVGQRPITEEDIPVSIRATGERDERLTRLIEVGREEGRLPGETRAVRMAEDASRSHAFFDTEGMLMRHNGWESVKELWHTNKVFRRGAIGVAAAVGFSALYSKLKDRSPEELAGPPLLPGGSFYEGNTQPSAVSGVGNNSIERPAYSSGSGTTYKVKVKGKMDTSKFISQAEKIVGTQAKGSVYPTRNPQTSNQDLIRAIDVHF